MSRSVYNYRSQARDVKPLVSRIKEITATRVHYGYRRVHVLLREKAGKTIINASIASIATRDCHWA